MHLDPLWGFSTASLGLRRNCAYARSKNPATNCHACVSRCYVFALTCLRSANTWFSSRPLFFEHCHWQRPACRNRIPLLLACQDDHKSSTPRAGICPDGSWSLPPYEKPALPELGATLAGLRRTPWVAHRPHWPLGVHRLHHAISDRPRGTRNASNVRRRLDQILPHSSPVDLRPDKSLKPAPDGLDPQHWASRALPINAFFLLVHHLAT